MTLIWWGYCLLLCCNASDYFYSFWTHYMQIEIIRIILDPLHQTCLYMKYPLLKFLGGQHHHILINNYSMVIWQYSNKISHVGYKNIFQRLPRKPEVKGWFWAVSSKERATVLPQKDDWGFWMTNKENAEWYKRDSPTTIQINYKLEFNSTNYLFLENTVKLQH
jgi:hypothetical protein